MHVHEHVENPETLEFFAALGEMGSLLVKRLVKHDRVKPLNKPGHIEDPAASFRSLRSSEES